MIIDLTPDQLMIVQGALSAQARYARNGLDHAKTDDAVDRWARFCIQIKDTMDAVGEFANGS